MLCHSNFSNLPLLVSPFSCFLQAFGKITDVFEHTLQIQHYDIPRIHTQNFVVASHDIDFLNRNLTDHNIENLYVKPLDPSSDRFELVHDYRRNPDSSSKKLCKDHEDEKEELLIQEGSSPGIFMAVEVEEVTLDLHSLKDVQIAITETLEQAGFKVESTVVRKGVSDPSERSSVETVLLLREGYVAIRTWPEHKYCAFDIHLWSSFEKHEAAKKAVVAGVGGNIETTSSYRIVAGGMFGVRTWKDDAKVHGPQIKNLCDRSAPTVRDARTDQRTMEIALDTGLRLIRDEKDFVAAVLCGNDEACPTIDLLKKNEKVGEVMAFYPCFNVTSNDQYSEDGRKRVVECERVISDNLHDSLSDNKRLRVIVVDKSAPRLFLQMVLRILTKDGNRGPTILEANPWEIVIPDNLMVMAMIEDETDGWRRMFLDKVRKDVVRTDPLFRAGVLFNSSSSSMELGIVSSGDKDFMLHLVDMVADVEKESGLALEIREMFGGFWKVPLLEFMKDEDAEKWYTQENYDRTLALQQWQSQKPVGHQTLFQLETRPLQVGDKVHAHFTGVAVHNLPLGEITAIHDDELFDIKFNNSDILHYPSSSTKVGKERFASKVERDEIRKLYGSPNDVLLSAAKVKSAVQYALDSMKSSVFSASEIQELEVEGDGCVFVAFCLGGSVIVMWDGRMHVDVNLFTFLESKSAHKDFEDAMKTELRSSLETILKDEQPRGFGRVVNHVWDLGKGERPAPHWA
jgi:S-adenosylmethionine/arginine decarboxylase-like enzyme